MVMIMKSPKGGSSIGDRSNVKTKRSKVQISPVVIQFMEGRTCHRPPEVYYVSNRLLGSSGIENNNNNTERS